METLEQKIARLKARKEELEAQEGGFDVNEYNQVCNQLSEAEYEFSQQQAHEQIVQQTAQEHEERVSQATDHFNTIIDGLDLGSGITLRQLIGDEEYYQLAAIGIKGVFQAQADTFSAQIRDLTAANAELELSNDNLRKKLAQMADEKAELENQLGQERLDHAQTSQYRDNAVGQLEEMAKIIEQKNGHIADLQDQISRGVGASIKTVNTEEEKRRQEEIAAKWNREHTVYDVVADDPLNPKTYTAKLAYNDQPVTYSWIAKNSYRVLNTQDEVSQFRTDHNAPVAQDDSPHPALDESIPAAADVAQFPEPPSLPTVSAPVADGEPSDGVDHAATERDYGSEIEVIKKRLDRLEKQAGLNTLEVA